MYENQQISNEVATNLKKNNETLIKNINRMGDISKYNDKNRQRADGSTQAA